MRERKTEQGVKTVQEKRLGVPRRNVDREANEGAAKMESVIDECLPQISNANERMRRRQAKIDRLKDENGTMLSETKRILAKLQAS